MRTGGGEGETRYRGATEEENVAKAGGAAARPSGAARRLKKRGDVLVKCGLIDEAALESARERVRARRSGLTRTLWWPEQRARTKEPGKEESSQWWGADSNR
eukprot:SAG11_NODE_6512_length_1298_cov_17.737281_1_plen_102_part_00